MNSFRESDLINMSDKLTVASSDRENVTEGRLVSFNDQDVVSFISGGHGLKEHQVDISFSVDNHRMQPAPGTQDKSDHIWQKKIDGNPRIFNGSKFRLADFQIFANNNDDNKLRAELSLGITNYKDHVGTNLAPFSKELVNWNASTYRERFLALSQAIGVGGWVITSDNKFFLQKNADWKGEGCGLYDRPGGHAEPESALLDAGLADGQFQKLDDEHVRRELFLSQQKEVRDEVNIPLDKLKNIELLGLAFNMTDGGRVGAEFLIWTDVSSEEVLQLYRKGDQPEADESTELFFIGLEDFHKGLVDDRVMSYLTPHAMSLASLPGLRASAWTTERILFPVSAEDTQPPVARQ